MPETPRAGAAPGCLAMPSPLPEAGAPGVVVVHDLFGMTPGLRYDSEAAAAAWRRIFAFFGDHIGGPPDQPGQEPSSS